MLCNAKVKVEKWQERINFEEEEIKRRHREAILKELEGAYERLDGEMALEYKESGAYQDKGRVRRKIQTSVGVIRPRLHRLKRRRGGGSVYALLQAGKVARVSGPAVANCLQVAIAQPYERSRQTLECLCGMQMSRMGIWKVIQEQGRKERQRREAAMKADEETLKERMIGLACEYGRYGYRRVTALLRNEGRRVSHRRVQRLWR